MQSCSSRHDDVKCLVCCTDIFLFKHFKNTTQHLSLENMFWLCQHLPLVLFKDVNRIGIVYKCNEQRLIITNKENKKADYNVA